MGETRPELLQPFMEAHYQLIPLHRHDESDVHKGKKRERGKSPVHRNWTKKPYWNEDQFEHMEDGSNVGVRLRACDLVIDVDPRNFPEDDDPFRRLCEDVELDASAYPTVETGSGGLHVYMLKPEGVSVRDSLPEYEGVEFKTLGRQVVAPGSVHPSTKRNYVWSANQEDLWIAPDAPNALLDLIRRPSGAAPSGGGEYDQEQIAEILDALDPEDFREYDEWIRLMMACHHASAGDARQEFIEWSTRDPEYSDHGDLIGGKWDGLHANNDGPRVTVGTLRKILTDSGHADAIPRVPAEEDFDAVMLEELPEVESKEGSPLSPFDRWVWVADAARFVRRNDLKKYKPDQWKSMYAGLKPDGCILTAVWKGQVPVRKFESLVYVPESPEFPDGPSGDRYNLWRPSGVEASPGDTSWFDEHMRFMFPDDNDRALVMDYLATTVQRPAEKLHFALLIRGEQGSGKSAIGELMRRIIGDRNVVKPSNDEVVNRFTVWQEGAQLAIIEELMTLGRMEVANRLKPVITEPTLRIEEKYGNPYSIPNHLNLICFTNHRDALKIENGDRRWLVVFSPAKPREQEYYDRLFERIASNDGPASVKHALLERRVSLNAKGRAPETAAKEEMRRLSMGEVEEYLLEIHDQGLAPFDFDLVRLEDVIASLPQDMRRRQKNLRAAALKFLQDEIGAAQQSRYTKGDGRRPSHRLWSIRDHERWKEAGPSARIDAYMEHGRELVEHYEDEPV